MNTSLTVKELLTPLQTIIGVVDNKQTLPILSHVLIQLNNAHLTLITTDMEIELHTVCKVSAKEKVCFTTHAKSLINIVKQLPQETIIEFIIEETKIYIKANNSSFELNTFNHQDFPLLPKVENSDIIKVKPDALKELIKNTSFSMAYQDIRAYLNGLYFEVDKNSITVAATDGHRLSIGEIKQTNSLNKKKTVIIPRKTVQELTQILDKNKHKEVDIHLGDNYFYLISDNTTIISRLIDGNFPNYTQVIPNDHKNTIIINRQEFLDNLYQASIFIEDRTKGVKLIFKNTQLNIFSHSEKGQAKTQVAIKNFDKEIEVGFNSQYLIAILEKLTTDEINMVVPGEENQSCLLTSMDDKIYQYVVMPMRI